MVYVDIFEIDKQSQTIRTLVAFTIILFGNFFYLFLTRNLSDLSMKYLIIWLMVAIVLGVCVVRDNAGNFVYENSKRDNVLFGILIGLIVYIPIFENLFTFSFQIFITALALLFTYMISESSPLINFK